ncbi:MAG: hypothetical protein LBK22_02800 [Tannerella sp.]|jgi:hypothetical protein|nr:hypothetical protein [Tannerella sp.]
MAKKKKSRQTDLARHKIEETQRRNEYFKRMKVICDMIHPDLFPMLEPIQRLALYEMRGLPFRVVADGKVSGELLDNINRYANMVQREVKVPLCVAGEYSISLLEYLRYVSPLEWLLDPDASYEREVRVNLDRIKGVPWYESFFKDWDRRYDIYYDLVTKLLSSISCFASDLRYYVYYTYFESEIGNGGGRGFDMKQHQRIHVQPHRVERKRIKLRNGETRNALRLTVALPSNALGDPAPERQRFLFLSIAPATIGVECPQSSRRRPIYISEHALNRLDERTGCASSGYMQMFLSQSLAKGPARKMTDERLLLDFEAFDQKIGYLVVSIQHNSILIHTFLFLTANGTPEGKKLRELLGLQKADHQYLGIDKLSTFIHSDILQHGDVCEWFRKAGCESLLKICERLKNDEFWQQDGEQIQLAERMKEYLKTGEPADAWDFPEEEESEEENDGLMVND